MGSRVDGGRLAVQAMGGLVLGARMLGVRVWVSATNAAALPSGRLRVAVAFVRSHAHAQAEEFESASAAVKAVVDSLQ